MHFLIAGFIVYFLILAFGLQRIYGKKTALTPGLLIPAFAFKVAMAAVYGYLFKQFYNGDDTWEIHKECIEAWGMLTADPEAYFRQFLPSTSSAGENLVHTISIFFYNLEQHLISLILLPTVPITGGNYYLMILFLSAILFPAQCWLYTILWKISPEHKNILYLVIFWFAPAVFWLSGLRADGFIFLALTGLLIKFPVWIKTRSFSSFIICLAAFLLIFVLRAQVAMVILPGLLAWFVSERKLAKPWKVFVIIYAASAILTLVSEFLPAPFNFSQIFKNAQASFLALEGTRFFLPELKNIVSWFEILPYAFQNSFLRPYLWEAKGFLQIMAGLESLLLLVLFVLAAIKFRKTLALLENPLLCFLLFFSITLYLSIGYIVPFPGAIVRYRIFGELFLLLLFSMAVIRSKTN